MSSTVREHLALTASATVNRSLAHLVIVRVLAHAVESGLKLCLESIVGHHTPRVEIAKVVTAAPLLPHPASRRSK